MKLFLKDILIPSANHRNTESIKTNFGTGRSRIHVENTAEYQEFKLIIHSECIKRGFNPIFKPQNKKTSNRNVSMGVTVYFDKAGRSDLSGNLKCLEDSLEGYVYENDNQIKQYHHLKIEDFAGFNGFEVEILEIQKEKEENEKHRH